jgi:hypothetical protein
MYLDTSRDRFDPAKHYSAVLLQQGRVILDSDVAEQAAIWAYQVRTALADIIGPAGAPAGDPGFRITAPPAGYPPDITLSSGRAYVDGILIEAAAGPKAVTYLTQPDGYLDPEQDGLPAGDYVVYVRVWERSVTALQDPDIREVALGIHGPDTTGRAQVVWQVATWPVSDPGNWDAALKAWEANDKGAAANVWNLWEADALNGGVRGGILGNLQPRGRLIASASQPADAATDVCCVSPRAQYRGRENQHYRVEIFSTGSAAPPAGTSPAGPAGGTAQQGPFATYAWSRNNGAEVFGIESMAGAVVTVTSLGRDIPALLEIGDWVEIADDASASRVADEVQSRDRAVFQVKEMDALNLRVTLDRDPSTDIGTTGANPAWHPLLRRWDGVGAGGAAGKGIPVTEGSWLSLEDGVQVWFQGTGDPAAPARYRNGDYWLIPARTVLGDVIWPRDSAGQLAALPPAGVTYHYAPLAFISGQQATPMLPKFGPAATSLA